VLKPLLEFAVVVDAAVALLVVGVPVWCVSLFCPKEGSKQAFHTQQTYDAATQQYQTANVFAVLLAVK
jgi:hypothetical protein